MLPVPRKGSIFAPMKLKASQLRTVADRRFDDAAALRKTNENARANGAMYLGGFVIECMLKAKLLEQNKWLSNAAFPQSRSKKDLRLWSLCYRLHDLREILDHLSGLCGRLEREAPPRVLQNLRSICETWTVFARYSPMSAMMDEASVFLDRIEELKPWLM
jgi:hypothetical protein